MASGIASVKFFLNGTEYGLTRNGSTNEWTVSAQAPAQSSGKKTTAGYTDGVGPGIGANASGGYYNGRIKVTDIAGNVTEIDVNTETYGALLKLVVKETDAPICTGLAPSGFINTSTPVVTWRMSDTGSGVDPTKCYIKFDSQNPVNLPVSNVTLSADYSVADCTYKSAQLSEGNHSATVWGYDFDGNKSAETTVSFHVDTTKPTLSVSFEDKVIHPDDYEATHFLTMHKDVKVLGTVLDVNNVRVNITVTNGTNTHTYENVTLAGNAFEQLIQLWRGDNTVSVTATDIVDNFMQLDYIVTLDDLPPVISSVSLTPNPVTTGPTGTWTLVVHIDDA